MTLRVLKSVTLIKWSLPSVTILFPLLISSNHATFSEWTLSITCITFCYVRDHNRTSPVLWPDVNTEPEPQRSIQLGADVQPIDLIY